MFSLGYPQDLSALIYTLWYKGNAWKLMSSVVF